jgi:uncharacterized glyoxalase superfamily protein PhnB
MGSLMSQVEVGERTTKKIALVEASSLAMCDTEQTRRALAGKIRRLLRVRARSRSRLDRIQPKDTDMPPLAKNTKATIIPVLRYRDAPAAIEWLYKAFGFERHLVVLNDDGSVAHAQLSFGNGMIMLASIAKPETEFGRLMKQPDELGGAQTQTSYVVVADVGSVYATAMAAGARIATEIRDEDYGGRGFSCLDLEGHLWSFGSYDPW